MSEALLTVPDITAIHNVSRRQIFRLIKKGTLTPVRARACPLRIVAGDVAEALKPRPKDERFWSKVRKTETCWEWTAARARGYGKFHFQGAMRASHRHAYELLKGPIPEGLELDHICHNRGCVNPDHLRPVTTKQNQENCLRLTTPSGVRGVYRDRDKWRAQVKHEGRNYYNGNHATIEEAEIAAIALRNRLFTHNDHDRLDPALLATITAKETTP